MLARIKVFFDGGRLYRAVMLSLLLLLVLKAYDLEEKIQWAGSNAQRAASRADSAADSASDAVTAANDAETAAGKAEFACENR